MKTMGSLLALALLTACAPISVSVDYDQETDFAAYRSFGWLPAPAATGQSRADDPALHEMLRSAIEAQLTSQGLARADAPQLLVGYHVAVDQRLRVRHVSSPYAHRVPQGERSTEIRTESEAVVTEYEQGTLVIDVVDRARNALVWRGVGERRLRRHPTSEQMRKGVDQAVAEILGRFPPN